MASLQERLEELAAGIGQDVKSLALLLNNNAQNLNSLTTVNKQNLVAAINELVAELNAISGNASPKWPTAVFGNGVDFSSIVAGQVVYARLPYGGTIQGWQLVADQTCSCVADIWKKNEELPTVSDSITASAKPTLVNESVNNSNTLTDWDTDISEGDVLGFRLNSFSGTAKQISISLKVT